MRNLFSLLSGLFVLIVGSGCMQTANLAAYQFSGKTIAVVSEIPDAPFADFDMTIFDRVGQDVPIANREPVTRGMPSLVVEKTENGKRAPRPVSEAHVLIDSVLADFDMSAGIVNTTLDRGASVMRLEAIDNGSKADYLLEVIVDDYGIGADAWTSTAYFEVMGSLRLLENGSNDLIWEGEVLEIAPLTKALLTVGIPADKMETPAGLSKISVEEMREVLNGLAAYASIQMVAPLREAFQKNQQREAATLDNRYMAKIDVIPSSPHDQ